MAIDVFKIINKQTPVYLHDLVTIKKSSYSFRYNNTVSIPRVNTTRYGLHSLRYGAAKLWNELPNDLREGISLNNLKNLISKWDGDGCSCSFCSLNFNSARFSVPCLSDVHLKFLFSLCYTYISCMALLMRLLYFVF